MNLDTSKTKDISHDGWERYYQEQNGEKAWNGVPDEYLLQYLGDILHETGAASLTLPPAMGETPSFSWARIIM